jgi:Mn2+/Fe2+ NRAMP family transporter
VVPGDSWLLIVALVGTNFSINAAFYTSYGTKERGRTAGEYRDVTIVDTVPGIIAPGVMTALVIVVAAAVLGRTGESAATMADLAGVFAPLAGPVGSTIFALGFFGAAFSSMIANATAGGTMLSDGLGRGPSSSSTAARTISAVILAFGVAVALIFQAAPVQLIVTAQALTVFVAPVLATLILVMANRRGLMGEMRNRWWQNLFGVIGLLSVLALSVRLALSLLGG